MAARLEKIENSAAHVEFEIAVEAFEEALEHAYRKVVKEVAIPGFRRGRVPRQILEAQFGREVLYEDALDRAIPLAYEAALEELQIKGLAPPELDVEEIKVDQPVVIKAIVAVKPEVSYGDIVGLKLLAPKVEINDEDIAKQLQSMRESYAEVVSSDEPAVLGDTVYIDFEGFIDGEAFEGGRGMDYPLDLGTNTFIPGFEEQLVGVTAGSDVEVKVPFPEDYQAEDLAGKDAIFKVKVNRVETKKLRDLDDEFVQEISNFDTLEELREDLRTKSIAALEQEQQKYKREQAVSKALETAEMELADALIEVKIDNMLRQFEQQLLSQGVEFEDYLSYNGMELDTLRIAMRPEAIKNLRTSYLLEKIADDQGIVVFDDEVEAEMKLMAESMGMEVEEALERFAMIRESLVLDMRINRAVDYLVDNAVITELEPEELQARLAAERAAAAEEDEVQE